MRMLFALCVSAIILLQIPAHLPAQDVLASNAAVAEKGNSLVALERKLLGTWRGPACGGDYTFRADGTFDVRIFHTRPKHTDGHKGHPLGRSPANIAFDLQDLRHQDARPRPD